MKYNILKNKRIPNNSIYDIVLTLILAFAIVWILYVSVPYVHYCFYLTKANIESKTELKTETK